MMMLKILFFAHCDGERYSHQIVKRIKYDIRYQYFTGNLHPKYRTICRFRTIDVDLLASYVVQIVALCEELGLSEVYSHEQVLAKKLSSPSGQAIYKRHQILVEPVFGNIKFNVGFNRFYLRSLQKAKI